MTKVVIFDGYVDEPTCLGVPPYISPYPRYIAGAIWSVDSSIEIQYVTIDHLRHNHGLINILNSSDIIIVIAGISVPGKYFATRPMSSKEAITIFSNIQKPLKFLCGPATQFGYGSHGGKKPKELSTFQDIFDGIIKGDSEIYFHQYFSKNNEIDDISLMIKRSNAHEINDFAINGAKIVTQHPYFPHRLLTEIETYRGCARSIVGGCSFCSEPLKGKPEFRPINDIIKEVKELYDYKIRHIRLGSQPCIFSYYAKDAHKQEFPTPNPEAITTLFNGIRTNAPLLKTFHIDNANPGVIAKHPEESKQVAEIIIKYHSPGDVAAFGVESVDPQVIEKNNLKATEDEVLSAVEILNEVGSVRGANGLPELLPGLNFLYGLFGERKKTFELNYHLLKTILEKNLLLRRINIRQVIPIDASCKNTIIYSKNIKKHHSLFHKFKKAVSTDIDRPMLTRLVPIGTILKDVIIEKNKGKIWFGRQMGSYPLLVGIVAPCTLHENRNVTIVDHGFRSLTAIPQPLNINSATLNTLEALPMIGKKRAMRLIRNRPYDQPKDILTAFDDKQLGKKLIELITFTT